MSQDYYRKCTLCSAKIQEKIDSKRFERTDRPSKIQYGHKTCVERKAQRNKHIEEI